jgi:hypothetical protein
MEGKQSEAVPPGKGLTSGALPQQNGDSPGTEKPRTKSVTFYLTFAAILVNLFLFALDATTLAVATPMSAHPLLLIVIAKNHRPLLQI